MNRYPVWKNLLVLGVVLLGLIVALPNLFGEDPALQVSRDSGAAMVELEINQIKLVLDDAAIDYTGVFEEGGRTLVRFASSVTRRALPRIRNSASSLPGRAWMT